MHSKRRPRRPLLLLAALACVGLTGYAALGGAGHATAAPSAAAVVTDPGGTALPHRAANDTGALGVTFSFETTSLNGGPYNSTFPLYNLPMYQANTGNAEAFWVNYVEQLVSSGVDYVAVDTRGYVPGSAVPNEGGDPRELTQLVTAINQAGDADKLKIAAFDDTPASMTDKMNQIVHGTSSYDPPFDFSVTTGSGNGGYKYLWNNDLEAFFQAVPSNLLYKVNGQPLVYLWSDNAFAFTNQGNGNSARYLGYVRSQAESTFNENPYFVVDNSWIKNDAAVASVVQGEDDWFGVPTPPYTNQAFNGVTVGVAEPSFEEVNSTLNRVVDPNHGTNLVNNLQGTVGNNDGLTLVEGFSDWPENAALWRTQPSSYSATHRDYPNQDINILRRYSRTPFPASLTVQTEGADAVTGAAANPYKVYRSDLGVQATTDTGGGWDVSGISAGETETWDQVPLQGTEDLTARVASTSSGGQFRFIVDGVDGPVVTVPNTGGAQTWQTVDAGTFQFNAGTYHTVEIQYLTGGFSTNWWQATSTGSTTPPSGCGTLASGQTLTANQSVPSCNGQYKLILGGDGNLVLDKGSTALWNSKTSGSAATRAVLQTDGNLVLYNASGSAVWASGTAGNTGARLAVQDDGNTVIYSSTGTALWSTATAGE